MPPVEPGKAALRASVRVSYLLQVPLFIGLVLALLLLAITFLWSLVDAVQHPGVLDRTRAILLALDLLDMIFIANLITMVMVSGYNTYYTHGISADETAGGFALRDGFSSMKPKIAATIVMISAIHLLHQFLAKPTAPWQDVLVLIAIHLTLLITAVLLWWTGPEYGRPAGEADGS